MKKTALLGILSVLVVEAAGCMMGPNYKRPTVSVPTGYRSAMPDQPAAAASLGNEKWWDVYQDPVLADLIHTALQQNYDVRIAASRVLEAQAQLGITRANQFPSASVGADIFSQQNGKTSNQFPPYQVNAGQLNLSVIWNLDFWGKYRRQAEAARAQVLASEWGQRAVISSLVANVATAYFQLRALDSQRENWCCQSFLLSQHLPHWDGRARKQRAESVHQHTLPDLVRRPQRLAACLSRRSSPIGTKAEPSAISGGSTVLPANRRERLRTGLQFTRRFSKRSRVPRATGIAHAGSTADQSTVRRALQA